ncbi:hypothetical protein AX16_002613 [Volvariella volvacea WC 439]|nr:hypothetical protein AX16_002613 [Volvariella volvacea WC 439]
MEYRAALLESKRLIDSKKQSQREELLRSSAVSEKPVKDEKVTDDKIMKANEEITDALRRTLNIMQGELEKSVLNSQMLDSSTAMLQSTSTTHDMLTNLMDTSKQLITALEKSDWIDRLLIFFAFTFFLLVVLFIIKQRIIDRGIRIAFWWTRFIPDFSGDAELLQVEEKLLSASVATAATELESQELSTVSVVITSAASMSTGRIVSALSRLKSSAILHDPVITDPASRMPETSVTQSESEPYSLLTASELDIPPSSTPASEAAETPVHIEL